MIRPWIAFSHCGLGAEEDQRRADRAEQHDADQAAGERATAARDRHPADDHRRDHLELQPVARVGIDVGQAGPRSGAPPVPPGHPSTTKTPKRHRAAGCPPAGRPRGPSRWHKPPARPRGVAGPRRTPRRPPARSPPRSTGRPTGPPEPLETRRQVTDELPLADVAERLAADHQRGERHHDRRQAQPGHQCPVDRPQRAPGRERPQADHRHRQLPTAPAARRPRRRC